MPLERKTTSRIAHCLLAALAAGRTVRVDLLEDHAVHDDGRIEAVDIGSGAIRSSLEQRLIRELCDTGIRVLNRVGATR